MKMMIVFYFEFIDEANINMITLNINTHNIGENIFRRKCNEITFRNRKSIFSSSVKNGN